MPFTKTLFPGLIIIEPVLFQDSRGVFFESYNEQVFNSNGIVARFVQDNQSISACGVIRGLHYQTPPHAQAKLIRVLRGEIIDCALDLRVGSPTFGKYFSINLSADNKKQLFIPAGFAHGFSVISDGAEVLYKCDAYYSKEHEKGIRFDDPVLAIEWQIPQEKIIVSGKDLALPFFKTYGGEFTFRS